MNDYIESFINIIISSLHIHKNIFYIFFKQIFIFINNLSEMTTDSVTDISCKLVLSSGWREGSTVVFIPGKVVYVKATFLRHPSMPRHRYAVSQTSLNHVETLEGEYKEFCVSEKLSWNLENYWDIFGKKCNVVTYRMLRN